MAEDKKKVAVLGVLFAGLLAVGAYQFVGSGPAEKKPVKKEANANQSEANSTPKTSEPKEDNPAEGYYTLGLTPRNPFLPAVSPNRNQNLQPESSSRIIQAPPESKPQPKVSTPYSNQLPPWNPTMPNVSPSGSTSAGVAPPNEFTYVLIGIVEGPSPVAVFKTEDGSQKMVRVGEHVGQDTRVVRIENGLVVLKSKGKTITRRVGGNK